ncbi:MAG: hypothetical protein U1G07_18260 [Verrucomicrobiota bacterium]
MRTLLVLACAHVWVLAAEAAGTESQVGKTDQFSDLPPGLRTVLQQTEPLPYPRGNRLPLFILPIQDSLRHLNDSQTDSALEALSRRGIAYTTSWNPAQSDESLGEGLRIARQATRHRLPTAVDATRCIDGFFDGSPETLHIDAAGKAFPDLSFDPNRKMGCPLAVLGRVPAMRKRIEFFLRGYAAGNVAVDFVFADWEIDGPLEWNDAWAHSKRCERCRAGLQGLDDFRLFQQQIRRIRSQLQREVLAEPVRALFPQALVGNYGVYPHNGYRYWDDYYEQLPAGAPFVTDQAARYREWANEFAPCGYTMAMPVVYTWASIYQWYNFAETDYRWFYNGLLVGSNAGQHTPAHVPLVTFVHHAITVPPPNALQTMKPFAPGRYQALLWHLLLRGHDAFFLWCLLEELEEETRLVHQVYAASLAYRDFLENGQPVAFDIPKAPSTVISGLQLNHRVLALRTDFGSRAGPVEVKLPGGTLKVPPADRPQILDVR